MQKQAGRRSHVPAINKLPGLKLAAVATRNEKSAREAGEAFGADRWFSDPFAMIHDNRIDVVTISVKVPAHRELVLTALNAGKAVYCEAPLGRNDAEAEEMASAVGSLHTAIGSQGRLNPAVRRAAELISSGKIGRPLSASLLSTTVGFGPEMPSTHDLFNKTFPEPTCASLFRDSCRRRAQAFNQLYLELKTEMASAAMKDLSTGCRTS